jgi:hypothetical protein
LKEACIVHSIAKPQGSKRASTTLDNAHPSPNKRSGAKKKDEVKSGLKEVKGGVFIFSSFPEPKRPNNKKTVKKTPIHDEEDDRENPVRSM